MPYLIEHGQTGLLSPVGDPIALAKNVVALLQNAELASRLARNARSVSERYNWPTIRDQWMDLYGKLLSPEPPINPTGKTELEGQLTQRRAPTGTSASSGKP
jgi:hypothetical protein